MINAVYLGDVEAGEMVIVSKDGMTRERYAPVRSHSHCVFEHAMRMRANWGVTLPRHSVLAHNDHLACLHIAQVDSVDHIERAGLRGENVSYRTARQLHLPECKR